MLHRICTARLGRERTREEAEKSIKLGIVEGWLTNADIDFLVNLSEISSIPWLSARAADAVWIAGDGRLKGKAGAKAVESYLQAGDAAYNPEEWPECFDSYARAAQISVLLGRKNSHIQAVESHLFGLLDKLADTDPLFLSTSIVGLMLDLKMGERNRLWNITEAARQTAHAAGRYEQEWAHIRNLVRIAQLDNDVAKEQYARVRWADSYAAHVDTQPHPLQKQNWLKEAIKELHKAGGQREKIAVLQVKADSLGPEILKSMQKIKIPMDLEKLVNSSLSIVQGKTKREAIRLLLSASVTNYETLLEAAVSADNKSILSRLFSATYLDKHGRTSAVAPGYSSDEDDNSIAIRHRVFRDSINDRNIRVMGVIGPMLSKILEEHSIAPDDIDDLVRNTKFVPYDREQIFKEGLLAGLNGNLLVACHLLIPQIENSIRTLLGVQGKPVTAVDPVDGTEQYLFLGTLLQSNDVIEILGNDMAVEMQSLLLEKASWNGRNRLCHGLMDDNEFNGTQAFYVWWLVFRLCMQFRMISQTKL